MLKLSLETCIAPRQMLFWSFKAIESESIDSLKVTEKPVSDGTAEVSFLGNAETKFGGVVSTLNELTRSSLLLFPDESVTVYQHPS